MIRLLHLSTLIFTLWLGGCVIDTVPLPENSKDFPARTDANNEGSNQADDADSAQSGAGEESADSAPTAPENTTGEASPINLDSIYYSDTPIQLVGTPGALPGAGVLRVETTNSWAVEVTSTESGTFTVQLQAALNDTILLLFTDGDNNEYSASLVLSPGSVDAYSASSTLAGITQSATEDGPISLERNGSSVTLSVPEDTLSPGVGIGHRERCGAKF